MQPSQFSTKLSETSANVCGSLVNYRQEIQDAEARCNTRIKSLEDAWRLTSTYTCRCNEEIIREIKKDLETELNKLSHAVDYLLEHAAQSDDRRACKEMMSGMATGQRPFSGDAIRKREDQQCM